MHTALKDIGLFLLDIVLPERCVVCKREHRSPLCDRCLSTFTTHEYSICIACEETSPFGITHGKCKRPYTPDRLISIFKYDNPNCAEAIVQGKYKFVKETFNLLGKKMASILADSLSILNPSSTYITALPLHKRRERWRGFNQSKLLATTIAKELNFYYLDTLTRNRYTTPQKDLKKHKRETNILNCFSQLPNIDLTNKTVILVDDVATTGSTLKEAAKILKEMNANQVWCVTLAKE